MTDTLKLTRHDRVLLVELNRPAVLNALNKEMVDEMVEKLVPLDADPDIGCIVITGNEKAFAAGGDIAEMASKSYLDAFYSNLYAGWDKFVDMRTPKIAAVSGYALGGGCELAMMCDIIYAGRSAKFGQPEIKLGTIPGMGGSQRLTKLVGKVKAMDLVLTGRMMDADEAERSGLAARVIDDDKLMVETMSAATQISNFGKFSTMIAREAVERAVEGGLREGLMFERRLFQSTFATHDQKEGMDAFVNKRKADFTGT
jgi:enoyl-CoA hydratase